MHRLLMKMLAHGGYMAPAGEEGSDTGSAGPSAEVLAEHGLTAAEFAALDERDQQNLLADSPDDETPVEGAAEAAARAAVPAVEPPPTKKEEPAAAAPAPAAKPVSTPAKDEGADPEEEAPAAVVPPVSTAPAADAWRAVLPATAVDDMPDAVIVLPKIPEPPKWTSVVTPEHAQKLSDTEKALDDLERKFEEGEITREEWVAQRKPLQTALEDLKLDVTTDKVNARNTQAAVKARFEAYVDASLAQAKAAGLDYLAADNAPKLQELDAALRRYAQAAPLMNPGKPVDWLDRWALNQAHAEMAGKYGVKFGAAAPAPAAATGAKPAAAAPAPAARGGVRPPADLGALPPTLRNAPAAADAQVQQGEFAHLEALNPHDLEKAVARMTPEQQARYLEA